VQFPCQITQNLNDKNDITIRTIKKSIRKFLFFFYRSYRYIVLIVGIGEAKMNHFYPVSQKPELSCAYFGERKAMNRARAVNTQRFDVLCGAVTFVGFEAVMRPAEVVLVYDLVADLFGDDGGCGD